MAFASVDQMPNLEPGREDGAYPEIGKLKTWFRESEEAFWGARRLSERVRDYVDGKQWTDQEAVMINKRGQSAIVFNRMRPKVDVLLGIEKTLRMDPQAYPRTPEHEEDAELATDAIRYVCDHNRFDRIASMVFDQSCAVEGEAGAEVEVEWKGNNPDPEIVIRFQAYDRTFRDPHSRLPDYSDARYLGTVTWIDTEQARSRWPDAHDIIGQTISAETQTTSNTFDDAPRYWADRARNRVQVIKMWWLVGEEWWVALFVGGGYLEEPAPSPYLDDEGNSVPGLELCSGYVTRQGERYGLAHIWMGPQDSINKRQSKALHLLSTRQTKADPGVIRDVRKMKSEMAKPDGHVQKDTEGEFDVLPTIDMAQGQFQLLQEAKQEIDQTGPNSAGTAPGDTGNVSGLGLQTQQQAGMLEVQTLLDHHKDWKLRIYNAIWARVRQYWEAPRWIRVTDDLRSMRFVGINRPVTMGEMLQREAQDDPEMAELLATRYAQDPRMQMVVEVQNQPAAVDVDIQIDEGPDVVTTAAQEFELLVRMWEADRKGELTIRQLIEASPMRTKDKLLEAMDGDEQAKAQAAQEAAEAAEIQKAGVMAELERTQADAARTAADARYKAAQAAEIAAKLDSDIDLTEAQTDKAMAQAASEAAQIGNVVPLGAGA